eukprot:GFUD01010315.1.p1 GENE.GFUD01010315.1~~GFUD01010315.1.p1  ORF type:complete len:765 (-),score=130.93 GFUD01010315.1:80-2374(-)
MKQLNTLFVFFLFVISVSAKVTSFWEEATVTYNPGEDCLPYDGSEVPNCAEFVDPETKWPFYHEHSSNCSRFWECGPHVETCLFECAPCQSSIGDNPMCNDQWALTFDVSFQYPDGPVCNWPSTIECDNGIRCDVNDDSTCNHNGLCGECIAPGYCRYHRCCETDDDCTLNSCGVCDGTDGTFQCVYPECCSNDDCIAGCNGECNLDGECTYDGCCGDSDCTEQCNGECGVDGQCSYPGECCSDADCGDCGTCGDDFTCAVPECCSNSDCTDQCGGECGLDGTCSYPECCQDADCTEQCNGECGVDGQCSYPGECCSNADCGDCGTCGDDFTCTVPECCSNSDCTDQCGGECGVDGTCAYPECCLDADCEHVDGVCNVPAPHDPNFCDFCNEGKCEPGCAHDGLGSPNCPATHPTCYGHVCGCTEDAECDNFDGECDMTDASDPYEGHCYYCDGANAQCMPGCGGLGEDNNYNCPANYECDLNTHQCEEMVCTEDSMCEGFDQVCNEAHDNCAYCGGCADLGCCPGCHDSDLNCKQGDICNMDTHMCEPLNECDTDLDCNKPPISGVCDTGNAIYTECFYCSMSSSGNTCEPGCKYDGPSNEVPSCPAAPSPICNQDYHRCDAAPGHQLLTYIKVTSNGCDGCDEEGLSMKLVGDDEVVPVPDCETVGLDHPGKVDYASVTEFRAVEEERPMGWGSCYESPLDGKISSASVTWTGTGTWRGNNICYRWNASRKVYICQLPAGSSLATGETAQLICASGDGVDCP